MVAEATKKVRHGLVAFLLAVLMKGHILLFAQANHHALHQRKVEA